MLEKTRSEIACGAVVQIICNLRDGHSRGLQKDFCALDANGVDVVVDGFPGLGLEFFRQVVIGVSGHSGQTLEG